MVMKTWISVYTKKNLNRITQVKSLKSDDHIQPLCGMNTIVQCSKVYQQRLLNNYGGRRVSQYFKHFHVNNAVEERIKLGRPFARGMAVTHASATASTW